MSRIIFVIAMARGRLESWDGGDLPLAAGGGRFSPSPVLKWYPQPGRRIPSPTPQLPLDPSWLDPCEHLGTLGTLGKLSASRSYRYIVAPRGACRGFLLSEGTIPVTE